MFNLRRLKQFQDHGSLDAGRDFRNSVEHNQIHDLFRLGFANFESFSGSNIVQLLSRHLRQDSEEPVESMAFDNPTGSSAAIPVESENGQASWDFISDFIAENAAGDQFSILSQLIDKLGPDGAADSLQTSQTESVVTTGGSATTFETGLPETGTALVETTNSEPVATETGSSSDTPTGQNNPEQETAIDTVADGQMTMPHEHTVLHDLVLHSDATHVAVANGDWFDRATWLDGIIPGDGARVLIPEGFIIEYSGESSASLFTIRVDGELTFAHDTNNFMEVDTLIVTEVGRLEIGTAKTPVEQGFTTQIQIADNGPIDAAWDGTLLSRGIISQGAVEMHGQAKQTHLKLAVDAMAGDTQLVLEHAPEGWNVGDKIVLTGTHLNPWHFWSLELEDGFAPEDEELTITAINGNQITLDRALAHDHDTSDAANKASVANYTRSIIINTENPDATPVSERGHVMMMGAGEDTIIKFVSFHELGRTDKSFRAVDAAETPDLTTDSNVKGRYALHLHEAGVDPDDAPIVLEGNAVWGSPGWGIVQHGSYAHLINNATYDTFGAAFVSEAGDEIGRWSGNIAVGAQGVLGIDKFGDDVDAFDLGRTGDGFWLQSRLIDVSDNVAASVNRGFVLFHRGGEKSSLSTDHFEIPEFGRYMDYVNYNYAPVRHFTENEVMASNEGLVIVKPGPVQYHDIRSVIDKFTAWEVGLGIHAEYTAHYTFKDISLSGSESDTFRKSTIGFSFGKMTFDMTVNDGVIDEFDYGVFINQSSPRPEIIEDQNLFLVGVSIENSTLADIQHFDPDRVMIVDSSDLWTEADLSLILDDVPVWSLENPVIFLSGTKIDSLGSIDFVNGTETLFIETLRLKAAVRENGYYVDESGVRIVIWEEYFSDRATGRIEKIGIPIEIRDDVPTYVIENHGVFHGVIDFNKAFAVARDDTVETLIGRSVEFDPVLNDEFGDNNLFRFVDAFTQPENGMVRRSSDGILVYTPDEYFVGQDEFDYWIQSDNGTFDRATTFITVSEQPVVSVSWSPPDDLAAI